MLSTRTNNFIASLSVMPGDVHGHMHAAVACMDVSTGAFFTNVCTEATLLSELSRNAPSEVLIPSDVWDRIASREPAYEFLSALTSGTCVGLEGCVLTRQDRTAITSELCQVLLDKLSTGPSSSRQAAPSVAWSR